MKRATALLLVLVLCIGMLIPGCTASKGKGFVLNLGSEPPQLDPQKTTDTVSMMVLNSVMEGLVRLDKKGGYMPGMAKSWKVSDDGLTYTFTIRDDAKWSNGTPVTAADFEYGIKRALDVNTASEYSYILFDIVGAEEAISSHGSLDNVGVKADGNTLTITLKRPTPYFLGICAFATTLPCNEAFYTKHADKYASEADQMIYNGPWVISSWQHDTEIDLAKNDKYWNKDQIKLKKVTMYMITDTSTAMTMFYNGELDIVAVPGSYLAEVAKKGYKTSTYSDLSTFYLEVNMTDKYTSNANFRKALSCAYDASSFIKGVVKNNSQVPKGLVPSGILCNGKDYRVQAGDLNVYSFDKTKAKAYLATAMTELGIAKASDIKISILCDEGDVTKAYAAAIQEMYVSTLGIKVDIQQMTFQARLQKMTSKDFQVVLAGWGPDYNDPMTYLDMMVTGGTNNHTYYSNATFDNYITSAKNDPNQTSRYNTLVKAEKLLMEDLPLIMIYCRSRDWIAQDNIAGVVRRGIGGDPDLYWATKS